MQDASLHSPVDRPEKTALRAVVAAMVRQGQLTAALTKLREIVSRHPRDVGPRVQLALVHWQLGEKQAALDALADAFHRADDHPDLHYLRGLLLAEAGEETAASEALLRTLRLDGEHLNAWVLLAMLSACARRPDRAACCLDRARRLGKDEPDLWLYLGLAQALAADRLAAQQSFAEAAHRYHVTANLLRHPSLERSRPAGCQDPLASILGVLQDDPQVMEILADLPQPALPAEHWEQLGDLCDQVASQHENYPDIQYYCARLLARVGQSDRAILRLERAVRLNRHFGKAKAALAALAAHASAREAGGTSSGRLGSAYGSILDDDDGPTLADVFDDLLAQTAEADVETLRARAQGPDFDVQARNALGLKLLLLHRPDEAISQFRAVWENDPANRTALVGLGLACGRLGRHAEALEWFTRAQAAAPDCAEILFWKGLMEERLGCTDEALAAYEQVVALRQDHADAWARLGYVALQRQRFSEAMECFRRSLSARPNLWRVRRDLADLLERMGLRRQAAEQMGIVADLRPTDPEVQYRLGRTLLRLGETTAALERFEQAAALASGHVEARLGIGHGRLRQGDFAGAERAYCQVLERQRDHVDALIGLSAAQAKAGRLDEAIATMNRLADLAASSRPDLLRRLTQAMVRKERERFLWAQLSPGTQAGFDSSLLLANGIAQLSAAAAANPDYADVHYRLAVLQQNQSLIEEAIRSLRQAIAIKPDFLDAMLRLARLYAQAGRLAQARRILHAAVSRYPTYPDLHRQLGELYAQGGQFEEAIARFQTALEHNPRYADGHARLAETLEKTGQFAKARQIWKKILTLDAAGSWVLHAQRRLAEARHETA